MKNLEFRIVGLNKGIGLAVLLIVAMQSFAQNLSDSLLTALKSKDLVAFKTYLELKKHKEAERILNRQILDNYYEYSYGIRTVPGYKINLLCSGNKIIYAKLIEGKKEKFEDKDSAAVKQFYKRYAVFFKSKVKLTEFFGDTTQYGAGCGFVGVDPPFRKKLRTLIATSNSKELTKWLQSAVTEKQLYGVEGFMELEKKDYQLTELQKKLIEFIKSKKGEAKTCNGCIYSSKEIDKIFVVKQN